MDQFCELLGITASAKIAKMANSLLDNKALMWWRSVPAELWAKLGVGM